jgi:hypothetical protein
MMNYEEKKVVKSARDRNCIQNKPTSRRITYAHRTHVMSHLIPWVFLSTPYPSYFFPVLLCCCDSCCTVRVAVASQIE